MADNNSIVYLYGFSTMLESKLKNLIDIVKKQLEKNYQVNLVFLHDGVIGTSKQNKITPSMKKLISLPITMYSLLPDLKARGIDSTILQDHVKGIEYEDLVDLLVSIPTIISWM